MKIKIYFILLFFLIAFFSCDYGVESGDDLHHRWVPGDGFNLNRLSEHEEFEFYNNNKGVRFHENNPSDGNKYYDLFTYSISQGNSYKILTLKIYNSPEDYQKKDYEKRKYEYYFNSDKSILYLKDITNGNTTTCFYDYKKYERHYKDNINEEYSEENIDDEIIE